MQLPEKTARRRPAGIPQAEKAENNAPVYPDDTLETQHIDASATGSEGIQRKESATRRRGDKWDTEDLKQEIINAASLHEDTLSPKYMIAYNRNAYNALILKYGSLKKAVEELTPWIDVEGRYLDEYDLRNAIWAVKAADGEVTYGSLAHRHPGAYSRLKSMVEEGRYKSLESAVYVISGERIAREKRWWTDERLEKEVLRIYPLSEKPSSLDMKKLYRVPENRPVYKQILKKTKEPGGYKDIREVVLAIRKKAYNKNKNWNRKNWKSTQEKTEGHAGKKGTISKGAGAGYVVDAPLIAEALNDKINRLIKTALLMSGGETLNTSGRISVDDASKLIGRDYLALLRAAAESLDGSSRIPPADRACELMDRYLPGAYSRKELSELMAFALKDSYFRGRIYRAYSTLKMPEDGSHAGNQETGRSIAGHDSKHFSSIPKRRRIDIALKIVYKKLLDAVSSNPSAPSPATGQ